MSSNQSKLSSSKYGYDFVVATTQASINATMKQYLDSLDQPEIVMCYVMDDDGNPQPIDYDTLVQNANGSDPFNVPDKVNPHKNQDVKNLSNAGFMYAFKAQIGLPPGFAPEDVPDIVTLGSNTASVGYKLMCSEFIVVEANYGPRGIMSWLNQSQPSDTAWLFSSKVDLRLTTTDQSAYSKLPPAVQAQIKNLGGNAFSVQQLLFDLDNAALESVPTILGVGPGTPLYTCLQTVFLGAYFTTMQKKGQPVLGAAITHYTSDPSTLVLTDLNMEVNPFVGTNGQPVLQPTQDQQDLSTLNYLCAANGNNLPTASQFTWNWTDTSEELDYHGVVSINRNTFADYVHNQLQTYVTQNCFQPHVRVYLTGTLHENVNFELSLKPGQTPTVTKSITGSEVLHFSYSSTDKDSAGVHGDMGQVKLSPSFDVSVSFLGNTITIVQHLVIYLRLQSLQTAKEGNIVDKTITDTYTLSINQQGGLEAQLTSSPPLDHSKIPSTNWFLDFFTDINRLIEDIATWASNCTNVRLQDIPLSTVNNFVFPGGKTFSFKNVAFSENQDLVAHIIYVSPDSE